MNILHKSIAALLIAHSGVCLASPPSAAPAQDDVAQKAAAQAALSASGPFLQGISEKERQRLIDVGSEVTSSILEAYEQRVQFDKSLTEQGQQQRKFADSIADEALQAERDKALEFLGLDPGASTGLYVFVSWSMPLEMLRAYVLDAMWSGASVLFKGTPADRTLADFILKDLQQLVYGKSAAANISIDPRMFDIYKVDTVPTIVYSTMRSETLCDGGQQAGFEYEKQHLVYNTCPPLDDSKYWKITGAISTHFALEQFKEAKAPGVERHQRALAKGYAEGKAPGKEQLAFGGKWESVLSPQEAEAARSMAAELGKLHPEAQNTTPTKRTVQGVTLDVAPAEEPRNPR